MKKQSRGKDPRNNRTRTENAKDGYANKRMPKRDRCVVNDNSDRADNDPNWYVGNQVLATAAGNVNFFNPLGQPWDMRQSTTPSNRFADTNFLLPGVMVLETAICGGGTQTQQDQTSILNDIANDLYANIRYMNSGHSNYEATDYMLYYLGVVNCYFAYSWLTRVYGVLRTYSAMNKFAPDAWLYGMGVNYSDLIGQETNLLSYIETFRAKCSQFCVPGTMPWFQRSLQMYSSIYLDGPGAQAQTYLFNPTVLLKYSPKTSTQGGELLKYDFTYAGKGMNLANIKQLCDTLIQPLIGDEDIGIMSGDTLKAFGAERCATLPAIGSDYRVLPWYDQEILNQINNSVLTGALSQIKISQVQGMNNSFLQATTYRTDSFNSTLTADDKFKQINAYAKTLKKPLRMLVPNPTVSDVMASSRYMYCAAVNETAANQWDTVITDSDFIIVLSAKILQLTAQRAIAPYDMLGPAMISTNYQVQALAANFSAVPLTYIFYGSDVSNARIYGILGSIDTYAILTDDEIRKMNTAARMSEFNFPIREGN